MSIFHKLYKSMSITGIIVFLIGLIVSILFTLPIVIFFPSKPKALLVQAIVLILMSPIIFIFFRSAYNMRIKKIERTIPLIALQEDKEKAEQKIKELQKKIKEISPFQIAGMGYVFLLMAAESYFLGN